MEIRIKRAYDGAAPSDGCRILVDRLWPRGITRETARLDAWEKDLAPSPALRKWYGHDPSRWEEFRKQYRAELAGNPETGRFAEKYRVQEVITLIYTAKNENYTHALVLQEFLLEQPGIS